LSQIVSVCKLIYGGSAHGVLDPAPVAGIAEIEDQSATNLVECLTLGYILEPGEELLDLLPDVPCHFLVSEVGGLGVGDGLDGDTIATTAPRL
jgi:hypothetical protein